jgi:hypothetical protein
VKDRHVGKALPAHGASVVPATGGASKSPTNSSANSLVSYAKCKSESSAAPDVKGTYQIKIFADVSQFLATQPQPELSFSARRLRVDVSATAYPDEYPKSAFAVQAVTIVSERLKFGQKDVTVTWDTSLLTQKASKGGNYKSFSIATSVKWGDKVIDGHILRLPGFGSIHFGEVLQEKNGFRLTLARLDMGSDTAADVSICDVRPGGEWMP